MMKNMIAAICGLLAFSGFAGERGLIGYWNFDEGSGEDVRNVAQDKWHGKILHNSRAVHWVKDGYRGNALEFDVLPKNARNAAGAVKIPIPMDDFEKGFTISCWVRMNPKAEIYGRNYAVAVCARDINGPGFLFQYIWSAYQLHSGDGKQNWSATAPGNDYRGKWIHICGTWDGEYGRFYLNGQEAGRTKTKVAFYPNGKNVSTMSVGSGWLGAGNGFPGAIDELKLYNYALNARQVLEEARLGL